MTEATVNQVGSFLVAAPDIERARDQTTQFYAERHPERMERRERWFPDKLSPNGAEPATHYLCWYRNIATELFEEMCEYISEHAMPLTPELVDGPSKEAWAASKGLKLIEARR